MLNPLMSQTIKDELSPSEFRAYGESSPMKLKSRLGELTFTKGGFAGGYPILETIDTLKNELDFQKATQAYIWAVSDCQLCPMA